MTTVYVNYDEFVVDSEYSDEAWGPWRQDWTFNLDSVTLSKKKDWGDYESINTPNDVVEGQNVHVLWMTYSSGDSFGCASGKGEIIWVFTDYEVAKAALDAWENPKNWKNYAVKYAIEDGTIITSSNPADGYFSDLGEMRLDSVTVTA